MDTAYQIFCKKGKIPGSTIKISSELTVGRESSCDLVLDDPKVSRVHGVFQVQDGYLNYTDNGSTNGSLVNGNKVSRAVLKTGDVIRIGTSEFAVIDDTDYNTINFVMSESMVTGVLNTKSVQVDALAEKFSEIFEYYKEHQPESSDAEKYELVRTQRLLNGLRSIYTMSQSITELIPLKELLPRVAECIFDVFQGTENLAILLYDEKKGKMLPCFASSRSGEGDARLNISQTVLDRAIKEKVTLTASDVMADSAFKMSESIIDSSVKSIICAPLVAGENVIGVIYLDNRKANVQVDELDAELVTAFANQCAVAIENARLCDTLQEHYHQTLQTLVNAIEARDEYTKGHTARVSKYSVGTAKAYGLPPERIDKIKLAADLHDIGKIGVREGLINKPGKLTDTEYMSIKDHVEMGEKILRPIAHLRDILPFIRGHHEKWDGSGYPDGLVGEDCPLEARIIAIADVFDAMTSQRSYNNPLSFSEALSKIQELSGKHFDPRIVRAFEKYVQENLE